MSKKPRKAHFCSHNDIDDIVKKRFRRFMADDDDVDFFLDTRRLNNSALSRPIRSSRRRFHSSLSDNSSDIINNQNNKVNVERKSSEQFSTHFSSSSHTLSFSDFSNDSDFSHDVIDIDSDDDDEESEEETMTEEESNTEDDDLWYLNIYFNFNQNKNEIQNKNITNTIQEIIKKHHPIINEKQNIKWTNEIIEEIQTYGSHNEKYPKTIKQIILGENRMKEIIQEIMKEYEYRIYENEIIIKALFYDQVCEILRKIDNNEEVERYFRYRDDIFPMSIDLALMEEIKKHGNNKYNLYINNKMIQRYLYEKYPGSSIQQQMNIIKERVSQLITFLPL